jgi:hypothetical protein
MQLEINALKEAAVGRASASVPEAEIPAFPGATSPPTSTPARHGVGTPATASR